MRLNIKTKFMISNIIIILPMLVLIIYFSVVFVDQYNLSSAKKTLLNDSYLLQAYLYRYFSENDIGELSEKDLYFLNHELSKMVNLRSQILFLKNNIYVDSLIENNDVFADFVNEPEIKIAINNKKNYILKRVNGNRFMLISFPFYSSQEIETTGVVRLIYPLIEIDKQRSNLIKILSLLGLIVLALINILYLYLTEQIVTPLYKLKAVVQLFSSVKINSEVKINSGDEIEDLANSFNKMAKDIAILIESLKIEKKKQKVFYNNMTHEIRTPLTTILGYTDLIKRVDSKEMREEGLFYIESEGKRLLRMINELLRSSKLDLYNFEINKKTSNLSKLVQETIDLIRYKANKYDIKINQNIEEEIYLQIDKDKIKETILNLMDNAIKYSGTKKIDIFLATNINNVYIVIKDYGKGISKKKIDRSKKNFSGIKISNISDYDGHGFGLSISQKIIELHGGEFNIQSTAGKGTIISIRLNR